MTLSDIRSLPLKQLEAEVLKHYGVPVDLSSGTMEALDKACATMPKAEIERAGAEVAGAPLNGVFCPPEFMARALVWAKVRPEGFYTALLGVQTGDMLRELQQHTDEVVSDSMLKGGNCDVSDLILKEYAEMVDRGDTAIVVTEVTDEYVVFQRHEAVLAYQPFKVILKS